ncbi:sensor histidine kinase [Natronomonas sp. EA1]|uniref:sensor histidine kinase n=1 Tax=Natronomonas sp. EA1 TaxID=3421655 RepID=UPI003EBE1B41
MLIIAAAAVLRTLGPLSLLDTANIALPGVLLVVGWLLVARRITPQYARSVLGWSVAGGLVLSGVFVVSVAIQPRPEPATVSAGIAVFLGGWGAVAGLVSGVKSVERVAAARTAEAAATSARLLEAERDRLEGLSRTSRALMRARTDDDVRDALCDGVESNFDLVGCALWTAGGHLQAASAADLDAPDPAQRAFTTGETQEIPCEDGWTRYLPIGEYGVLAVTTAEQLDPRSCETLDIYVSTTAVALERVARETDLRRQNELLDEFASVVSHDIRNSLSTITGYTQLVRESKDLEKLEHVETAARDIARFVEEILTLTREGQRVGDFRAVSLTPLVRRAWERSPTAEATLVLPEELPRVAGDGDRLQQLLENLFRNAVEHARDDVTVTVRPLPDGFAVEDDGPGIPVGERELVVERGYTAGGTGLGLTIVNNIIEAHGGYLVVDESPNGGARFELRGLDLL